MGRQFSPVDQWKIKNPMIKRGMGTPRSHKRPYFMGLLLLGSTIE
jgi:hypothetical protein